MRNFIKISALASTFAFLTACSSSNNVSEVPLDTFEMADGSKVGIKLFYSRDDYKNQVDNKLFKLRVITRGDNAAAVAGDVTKTIFCNPLSLFNLIGVCEPNIYTHKREELEGTNTDIDNIAYSYALPKYKSMFKENVIFSRKNDYSRKPIYFYFLDNYLVFDDRFYKLGVGFKISSESTRVDQAFTCKEEKSGYTLEQWQADKYALAISEGQKMVDKCFERFDQYHFENIREKLEMMHKDYL